MEKTNNKSNAGEISSMSSSGVPCGTPIFNKVDSLSTANMEGIKMYQRAETPDFEKHLMGDWGAQVDESVIAAIPAPRTKSHRPVEHLEWCDLIKRAAIMGGYDLSEPVHVMHPAGRFATLWGLAHEDLPRTLGQSEYDVNPIISMVSSYDKTISAWSEIGCLLRLCDNLTAVGGIEKASFRRKQTKNIGEVKYNLTFGLFDNLLEIWQRQSAVVDRLEETAVSDKDADHIIGRVARLQDGKYLNAASTQAMFKIWKEGENPEDKPRNAWSLYNSYTARNRGKNYWNAIEGQKLLIQEIEAVTGTAEQAEPTDADLDEIAAMEDGFLV